MEPTRSGRVGKTSQDSSTQFESRAVEETRVRLSCSYMLSRWEKCNEVPALAGVHAARVRPCRAATAWTLGTKLMQRLSAASYSSSLSLSVSQVDVRPWRVVTIGAQSCDEASKMMWVSLREAAPAETPRLSLALRLQAKSYMYTHSWNLPFETPGADRIRSLF